MINSKKIAIICAMHEEASIIIDKLNLKELREASLVQGQVVTIFENDDLVLIECSIGKVAAGFATHYVITNFNPEVIINIGVAGAVNQSFNPGDVFFVKKVFQHDVYVPGDNYQDKFYARIEGEVPEISDVKSVVLATGDQFIDDITKVEELSKKADLVDMEGYAVAYTAEKFNTKTILIKAVSDKADFSAKESFEENLDKAMNNSVVLLKKVLDLI